MESINTRIIELSIKKRMKRMNLTALLLSGVCLLCHPLQAQQSVDACDGRTYKVGDTLRIGEPLPSGYLYVKRINADNKFDKLNPKNSTGRTAVITDIPAYQPKLYQQFGIYQQPKTPQIVFAEQGFHVNYISPNNEPNGQWHTNSFQEGSFATKADLYRMVEELDKAISEAQIDTKILIPEVGDMKYLFEIDSITKTPDDIIHSMFYKDGQYSVLKFKNLFNCVAAHDYWSAYPATLLVDIRNRIHKELSANSHNTKFWASEYCILEKNEEITMPASPKRSINLGLYVARIIHNDLTLANASAWQWWTAVSLGEDVPIQLLPLEGSNGLSLQYDGEISTTKMLWTTANYSFFVRPGMKRISVKPTYKVSDLEAATSLMISSYTDGKEVVTVAINYLEENQVITLNCDHAQKGKVYLTTIDKNLQYMGEQPLKKLQLPARSVATIVVEDN